MAWTKAQTAVTLSIGALLVGTGAYETHRAARLNIQNQTLQQQQTQLAGQILELQKERDDTTNQIAAPTDASAQNEQDRAELLRLRGEVAQLRPLQQQLAQLKAGRESKSATDFTNDSTGPNKILYDFLGDPAPPPPNLNRAYTKEGLTEALQLAAQNAGITLKRIEVDDSEFPCVVGVVCDKGDYPKLKDQFQRMPDYEYSGSVGNDTCNAFNITPYRVFSGQAGVTINRRLTLRMSILNNKISGQQ